MWVQLSYEHVEIVDYDAVHMTFLWSIFLEEWEFCLYINIIVVGEWIFARIDYFNISQEIDIVVPLVRTRNFFYNLWGNFPHSLVPKNIKIRGTMVLTWPQNIATFKSFVMVLERDLVAIFTLCGPTGDHSHEPKYTARNGKDSEARGKGIKAGRGGISRNFYFPSSLGERAFWMGGFYR